MSKDVESEMQDTETYRPSYEVAIGEVVTLNTERLAIGRTASDKAWEFANRVFDAFQEFGKTNSPFAQVDKTRKFHAQLVLASNISGALDEWPEDSSKAASTVQYCQKLIRAAALMAADSMAEFRGEILLSEAITMSSFCTKAKQADTVRNLITSRHTAGDWRDNGGKNANAIKIAARDILGLSNPRPPSGNDGDGNDGDGNDGGNGDSQNASKESEEASNIATLIKATELMTVYNGLTKSGKVKLSAELTEAVANLTEAVLDNISDVPDFLDQQEMIKELTE
ncbi:MAG: hypothetical protein CBD49_01010 [Acidimicrobiaceae bacterium TMED189]|nr:MAG: hypothetical protein CBD49_01010 [Acidimicrobiaceae bacterium TMED189]